MTTDPVVPKDDEYYTLDLDRTPDEDDEDSEKITDQNTISADVGNPGHWGIDEDTG